MDAIRDLTITSLIIRIILSIFLGGIIGLERGLKNHPAGLRTYILVCMGACIVMITNQYVYQAFDSGDPVRMGAQVISGIGFLGAGTIIVTSRNQIKGLTTAAGLWTTACVGLAIGIGLYEVSIIGGLAIFIVLTVLNRLDRYLKENRKTVEVYIELDKSFNIGDFIKELRSRGIKGSNIQLQNNSTKETSLIISLKSENYLTSDDLVKKINSIEGVSHAEEL